MAEGKQGSRKKAKGMILIMKRNFRTIASSALLLVSSALCSSADSFRAFETNVNGITYRIDPRIELFNVVCMQFGHSGMTPSNIPYKQEILAHFSAFRNHPAVDFMLNTWKNGWGVDDPIFFLLCLDNDFHLMEGLTPDQIKRGGGLEHIQQLAALFKDFADQSGFYTWFNETQRPFYEEVIRQTAYNFRDFRVANLLENYYGEKQHSYIMVLNLASAYGNFGRAFTRHGETDLYAVVETGVCAGSAPVFAPSIALFTLIVHEFSHGFVNPAIDPYIETVDKDASLYEPIKDAMQAQGYYSWRSTVYETIVPAAVVRIAEQYYGKPFAEKNFYKQVIGRRFIYADPLLEKLKFYEQHRDQYPQFKNFVPLLLATFDHINSEEVAGLQRKVEQFRKPDVKKMPKPFEIAFDSTTYFIVGTHEPEAKAQAEMQAWVKTFRDLISTNILIITDDEALKLNLATHDIVLFGTPTGNAVLQNYMGLLPVTMSKDSVLTSRIIKGSHLQLVTSWISPFDPHHTMVIFTAQNTSDIKNYDHSPYKGQRNYWVGENTITLDTGDYVNVGKIWECDPN